MPASTLPLPLDLTVYAGTTFKRRFRWLPDGTTGQDFTGWTGFMLTGTKGQASKQFPVALDSSGIITIALDPTQTTSITGNPLIYQVDLTDPNGEVTRFLRGRLTVVHDLSPRP